MRETRMQHAAAYVYDRLPILLLGVTFLLVATLYSVVNPAFELPTKSVACRVHLHSAHDPFASRTQSR